MHVKQAGQSCSWWDKEDDCGCCYHYMVVKTDEVIPVTWRSVRIHLLRSQWLKPDEVPVHSISLWLEQGFQLSCSQSLLSHSPSSQPFFLSNLPWPHSLRPLYSCFQLLSQATYNSGLTCLTSPALDLRLLLVLSLVESALEFTWNMPCLSDQQSHY